MCNRNLPVLRADRQEAGGKSLDNHLILAGKAKTGFWQAHIRQKNMLHPAGGKLLDNHLIQFQLILIGGHQM